MVIFKSLSPPLPDLPPQNVVNILLHRPEQQQWPDFTALIDATTGKTRSWKELRERISLGSTALGSSDGLGLSANNGDMIGILSDNCLDYYTIVFSLLTIATPFALIPAHSTPFELIHLLKLSKPTMLFTLPKFLSGALRAAKEVGLDEKNIFLLEGHVQGKTSFDDLIQDVQRRGTPRVDIRPVPRNHLCFLLFSSGTTGLPKAVMISHDNVLIATVQARRSDEAENADSPSPTTQLPKDWFPKILGSVPLYHTLGLHVLCFHGYLMPATHVVMPRWDLETVLKVVPKFSINILPLVPSQIYQLVNHPGFATADWSSITHAGSAAAYLPLDLAQRFTDRIPVRISQGYGLSEATLGVTGVPLDGTLAGLTVPPKTVGVLMPSLEARIVRENGTDADLNEPGELWIRGGVVAMGYYNNEKATKEVFLEDGWLKTGDTFKTDGSFFFYVEREKDTLKVSGSQVSPAEIEAVIRAHSDKLVADVAVAGVSGGRTSDEKIPRAWVVLSQSGKRRGEAASVEALKTWTQESLAKYKWLRGGIEVIDEIPKSPTGKVLKRDLQDQYELRLQQSKSKL